MATTIISLAGFGAVIILMAIYGYRISAKTAEDYMLGGRTIGVVVMFFYVLFAISSAWTHRPSVLDSFTQTTASPWPCSAWWSGPQAP